MQRYKLSKALFSIFLTLSVFIVYIIPAAAANIPESESYSDVQNAGSITVPLNFDGMKPEKLQVIVENPDNGGATLQTKKTFAIPGTMEAAGGTIPERIQTNMTAENGVSPANITLITADRYFLYTPYGETAPDLQFYAEIKDLFDEIQFRSYRYFARLSATDENEPGTFLDADISEDSGKFSVYANDISSLISDTSHPATIYISIWDGVESRKLYGAVAITIKYIEDSAYVEDYYKYIHKDSMNFLLLFDIPGIDNDLRYDQNPDISLSLVNNTGQVVAKDIKELDQRVHHYAVVSSTDCRYDNAFGPSNRLSRNLSTVGMGVYRAADLVPGIYGIKATINGVEKYFPDLIQVVDGAIIKSLSAGSGNGFPPPVIGGSIAYIFLEAQNTCKDDFTIAITDENGITLGTSDASKYIPGSSTLVYHVKLNNGMVFEQRKNYYIKLLYSSGDIYYAGISEYTNFHPSSGLKIFSFGFNRGKRIADYNLKAVNVPENPIPIKLGLFSQTDYDVPIATVLVTPAESMDIQFKDAENNVLTLSRGSYAIMQYLEYVYYPYWNGLFGFNVDENTSLSTPVTVQSMGNPYFYTSDAMYDFELLLSKEALSLTDTTAYNVFLQKNDGESIGNTENHDITINNNDVIYYRIGNITKSTPAVRLTGTLAISGSNIEEGFCDLIVHIAYGSESAVDIKAASLSALAGDKVYATYGSNDILSGPSPQVVSGICMLKKPFGYDSAKFSYEMVDILGKPVSVGQLDIQKADLEFAYEDLYTISAPISGNPPAAYYSLKLKYDGKDLYSLSNPSVPLFSGYFSYKHIPAYPYLYSWYINYNAIYAFEIIGNESSNYPISTILYDSAHKDSFTPVKTVAPVNNSGNRILYSLSGDTLSGVDINKRYDIVVLCDGIYIGGMTDTYLRPAGYQYILGDCNGDSIVDANDAIKILRCIVMLDTFTDIERLLADVDGDNMVTALDASYILKKAAGIID